MEMPTLQEMGKKLAEEVLDSFSYEGKTIRQWANLIVKEDKVAVVRCKDCEYLLKDLSEREAHLCMRNRFIRGRVNLDDFCSYGERKELDNGKT